MATGPISFIITIQHQQIVAKVVCLGHWCNHQSIAQESSRCIRIEKNIRYQRFLWFSTWSSLRRWLSNMEILAATIKRAKICRNLLPGEEPTRLLDTPKYTNKQESIDPWKPLPRRKYQSRRHLYSYLPRYIYLSTHIQTNPLYCTVSPALPQHPSMHPPTHPSIHHSSQSFASNKYARLASSPPLFHYN